MGLVGDGYVIEGMFWKGVLGSQALPPSLLPDRHEVKGVLYHLPHHEALPHHRSPGSGPTLDGNLHNHESREMSLFKVSVSGILLQEWKVSYQADPTSGVQNKLS